MNKLIALLLALPLLCVPALAADRVENMKKVTVLVTSEGFIGGGRGSGILMDSTHVLTCAHMAESFDDEFFVYTYPFGAVIKAKIESVDQAHDLLLLKLERPVKVGVKPVFQSSVRDGESITIIGNTLGSMKWYVTRGIISGRERAYLMTDAQAKPGNSGGPWFNDKGEIVGITDWGLRAHGDITGGVSAKTIQETIKTWAEQKKFFEALVKMLAGKK